MKIYNVIFETDVYVDDPRDGDKIWVREKINILAMTSKQEAEKLKEDLIELIKLEDNNYKKVVEWYENNPKPNSNHEITKWQENIDILDKQLDDSLPKGLYYLKDFGDLFSDTKTDETNYSDDEDGLFYNSEILIEEIDLVDTKIQAQEVLKRMIAEKKLEDILK